MPFKDLSKEQKEKSKPSPAPKANGSVVKEEADKTQKSPTKEKSSPKKEKVEKRPKSPQKTAETKAVAVAASKPDNKEKTKETKKDSKEKESELKGKKEPEPKSDKKEEKVEEKKEDVKEVSAAVTKVESSPSKKKTETKEKKAETPVKKAEKDKVSEQQKSEDLSEKSNNDKTAKPEVKAETTAEMGSSASKPKQQDVKKLTALDKEEENKDKNDQKQDKSDVGGGAPSSTVDFDKHNHIESGYESDRGRSKSRQTTKSGKKPYLDSVKKSVHAYQTTRNTSRSLQQLKRAQIHTGPMHDIVMFSKMMDNYRRGLMGDEEEMDLRNYANWDGYLNGKCLYYFLNLFYIHNWS